ncbi:hypothetical protein VTN96DRAFT_4792 [Rasamsonia emersonii]
MDVQRYLQQSARAERLTSLHFEVKPAVWQRRDGAGRNPKSGNKQLDYDTFDTFKLATDIWDQVAHPQQVVRRLGLYHSQGQISKRFVGHSMDFIKLGSIRYTNQDPSERTRAYTAKANWFAEMKSSPYFSQQVPMDRKLCFSSSWR